MRSSEAVKKAKALFENMASTNQKTQDIKSTKLTDIGVIRKSPKNDTTIVSLETGFEIDFEYDSPTPNMKDRRTSTPTRQQPDRKPDDKPRAVPTLTLQSPESRNKSPMRQTIETITTKSVLSKYPAAGNEARPIRPETEKQDKVPSYQKPTKTSQNKEGVALEDVEVNSRRGSGKFGVELKRSSAERSTASSERRRSSDHHQPCIEDIFDLDLLEQMLEKVVGYEQRRRIRAQIRVAKKKDTQQIDTNTYTTTTRHFAFTRSPDRRLHTKSPERPNKTGPQKTLSPERKTKTTNKYLSPDRNLSKDIKPVMNGHCKVQISENSRPKSPEKIARPISKTRSPARQPSPEKKVRNVSPSKLASPKPKINRFNEYATAYMKKVGLTENDKVKFSETKTNKITPIQISKTVEKTKNQTDKVIDIKTKEIDNENTKQVEDTLSMNRDHKTIETKRSAVTKIITERTSSKETMDVKINGKRSSSPEKIRSPERKTPTDRLYYRSPSPDFKRRTEAKKETIIKTVLDQKKVPSKQTSEEQPSWVMNRNLKKISNESRSFSSKKIESEKARYCSSPPAALRDRIRGPIAKPIDVITSSYGPGPLDADGKPLFGIKALRNGASNYQVKGTVIRQEYHSRNGGEPEGTVSVTAYSSNPEELERLLQVQGDRPSRLHGLAAITTTKKFGGETGTSIREAHTREERAILDQFTHSDRRIDASEARRIEQKLQETTDRQASVEKEQRIEKMERRQDKKTVRQNSVKSLTEKYIKSTSDTSKSERASYPKAGLILRTSGMRDSVSSDSSHHAGLNRTDSEHSLGSIGDTVVTREGHRTVTTTHNVQESQGRRVLETRTVQDKQGHQETTARQEKSFLDSSTKVSGVQDILTRMKNADIVIEEGDSAADSEARALLNKFLGATVLMAGMQSYVTEKPSGNVVVKESVRTKTISSAEDIDLDQCWDERLLKKLLDESSDYEQRRRLRARIRTLMAEQEACTSAVTEALAASGAVAAGDGASGEAGGESREEEEVTSVTASVRRNSSEKTVSSSSTTKTTNVTESVTRPAPKTVSPFAKFRQLEKQNSTTSPNSPKTPQSPSSPSQPFFKFTDPALQVSALTIKERLLQWCRDKTRDYENVKLENFSTSWADGLAFCALVHHFLPDSFTYSKLVPEKRRQNFTLAFKVAEEKAGIYPLLDVDDMVAMRKPDWKCVFTYVQSIHRRFKDQD